MCAKPEQPEPVTRLTGEETRFSMCIFPRLFRRNQSRFSVISPVDFSGKNPESE
jgi:hypothetical protein